MKEFYWSLLIVALIGTVSGEITALNGQRLVISAQNSAVHAPVTRNSSGHVVKIGGASGDTIAVLSERFNFTYSYLQVKDSSLDNKLNNLPGLGFYMKNGRCDIVMGTIIMAPIRSKTMDFAEGYTYTTVAVLIPMPQSTANAAALIKPFQTSAWIALLTLIPVIAIVLYFSARPIPWRSLPSNRKKGVVMFDVVRTLLSQGEKLPGPPRVAVYFVLGSWCLATFVLISAYNSVLVSYILGSNAQPLVDSVTELAFKPDVLVSVNKGNEIDLVLSVAKDGIYKALGDKLRADPRSRCAKRSDCLQLVKTEQYTYIQSMDIALLSIDDDFKSTNICHLAIAKKLDPTPGSLAWALPKSSPYTRAFTKGFMELHQAGLIDFFIRRELQKNTNVNLCLNEADKRQRSKTLDNKTKITLKNLSGAFGVLILGCVSSLLSFLGQNVFAKLVLAKNRPDRFGNESRL